MPDICGVQGIRRTTLEISQQMGPEAAVAAIGQAGENLVPMAVVMNSVFPFGRRSRRGPGLEEPQGHRRSGTGSVHIAGDKDEWEKAVKYHLSLLGANNQHVVPNKPQPWAEYYNPGTRWVAGKGNQWGAAEPPIDTGTCDPHNLNRIAYRTNNVAFYLGDKAWKYTVRGNGCTGCPIRCHTTIKVPSVAAKYGIPERGQNTCAGLIFGPWFFKSFPDGPQGETAIEAAMVGMHLADDLGIWCNYSQMQRDFIKMHYEGIIKGKIGEAEYKSFSWDKYEKGDPSFLFEIMPKIAYKQGELGTALGLGTGYMLERWGLSEAEWKKDPNLVYWKIGPPEASRKRGRRPVGGHHQYHL